MTTALLISLDVVDEADTTRFARPLLQLTALMDPAGHALGLWTTPSAREHLRTTLTPTRRCWWPPRRRQWPAVTHGLVLQSQFAILTGQKRVSGCTQVTSCQGRCVR
ncbi:hypothetical protein, partial [Streptomyces carpaticus]|uniref:hypothetical protein n=1 Tax=Streptomyces carpaticus TaxID=285558 RepID=UPI003D15C576